jgi:TnpA family transposase
MHCYPLVPKEAGPNPDPRWVISGNARHRKTQSAAAIKITLFRCRFARITIHDMLKRGGNYKILAIGPIACDENCSAANRQPPIKRAIAGFVTLAETHFAARTYNTRCQVIYISKNTETAASHLKGFACIVLET